MWGWEKSGFKGARNRINTKTWNKTLSIPMFPSPLNIQNVKKLDNSPFDRAFYRKVFCLILKSVTIEI